MDSETIKILVYMNKYLYKTKKINTNIQFNKIIFSAINK